MKKGKKKTLKGSVLFTVVSVMALLIIFLTGTLALASASNNRAHKSYASSQASYTARAAIASFTEAMQREEGIVAALGELNETNRTLHPRVVFNDTNRSMGVVGYYEGDNWVENAITVELVNSEDDYSWYDDGNGPAWHQVETVRVSATCRVGREEETVSAVLRKGAMGSRPVPTTSSKVKGLNTTGDGHFPNGGRYSGGLGMGLRLSEPGDFAMRNATSIETTMSFINGNFDFATSNAGIRVIGPTEDGATPCSQTVINGDLILENTPFIRIDYTMDKDFTQKDIPYLYVDGIIALKSQCEIVYTGDNNNHDQLSQPYNIFAGAIYAEDSQHMGFESADLYLMDAYDPDPDNGYNSTRDYWNNMGQHIVGEPYLRGDSKLTGGGSKLHAWTYSVANRTDSQFGSKGGNVYCNGNLLIKGSITIDGDVRVEGDLTIRGSETVSISGDVVVHGKLTIGNDANNLSIGGTVYCDNIDDSRNNNRLESPSGGSYGGVQDAYKEVDNIYHEAQESKNVIELAVADREYFRWFSDMHYSEDGTTTVNIDGTPNEDVGEVAEHYYRWKENYAPGMSQYKNEGGEYRYSYANQADTYEGEGFVFNRYVDQLLEDIYAGSRYGDADIQNFIDTFVDTSFAMSRTDAEATGFSYRVRQDVYWNSDDTYTVYDSSIPTDLNVGDIVYYDLDMRAVVDGPGEVKPAHYTIADIDGNDTGIETTETKSYYRLSDGERVSKEVATRIPGSGTGTAYYDDYGQRAYPLKMTRKAIYGEYEPGRGKFVPADPATKIVKTLQEVRKEMNMDPDTGEYDPDVYLLELPAGVNCSSPAFTDTNNTTKNSTVWSGDAIVKNCTITGNVTNDIKIRATAGEGSSNILWIVLKDLYLTGADIIVEIPDDQPGAVVNFMLEGNIELRRAAIRNSKIYGGCDITYLFDSGMTFYGAGPTDSNPSASSSIWLAEAGTLVGNFKCPETTFRAELEGKYKVNYTDEFGIDWSGRGNGQQIDDDYTGGYPAIIGNALFKEVLNASNKFGIYYTESGAAGGGGGDDGALGGGGGEGFDDATGSYWEVGYFTGS